MNTDKVLTCADCGQQFMFTAREQEFYASRQFSEPRRCASCRASRKAARGESAGTYSSSSYGGGSSSYGGGGSGSYGAPRPPREMFDAVCSSCGQDTQVPFQPTTGKPVYCQECFATRRG